MLWLVPLYAFVIGSLVGSFSNVAIHRIPLGESIVTPRSKCPSCGHQLAWWENVPILSWLLLRARCRKCRNPISVRYPIVEIVVAALWTGLSVKFWPKPELAAYLAFASTLVVLSGIDLEHRRLPNKVIYPMFGVALVLFATAAWSEGSWNMLLRAGAGSLIYGVPMFVLAFAHPRGMGLGDVRLAFYIGLHLGWMGLLHVALGAFSAFTLGAVAGVLLIALGRKGRKDYIPFGPFMAAGALITLFWGRQVLDAWLRSL